MKQHPIIQQLLEVPAWIRWGLLVVTCVATVPPAVIYRARSSFSSQPRIHIIQNMDNQPKYVGQEASVLFADDRSMRPRVAGTVARGELIGDTHYHMGVVEGEWVSTFPAQITIDRALLDRGRDRFNIYCQPCHGATGAGDGLVHQRAMQLVETGTNGTAWVAPKSVHEEAIREFPVGRVFSTITNGARTMAGYGSQVPTADRWAIVAYVQALQFSQHADPALVEGADDLPRVDLVDEGGDA